MRYRKLAALTLSAILSFMIMINGVHALEKSGFTFELIISPTDLPPVIYDHLETPVFYTPQEITDFYLPLLYKKNTAGTLCLDRSDVAYYLKSKTNFESFEWVKGYYLKNVSYNELYPIYSCENVDYGNYTKEECSITNYGSTPKWILKWKPIPTSFCIDPNKWGAIYLHAHKNPTLESWRVDVVPVFKGIELSEYAWFSNDWSSRRQFNLTEDDGFTRVNEFVVRNFTGLTGKQADNDDLRIINDSDNSTIPFYVLSSTSDTAEIMIRENWTASGINTYYIYYNNPTATDPAYSTADWPGDYFDGGSLNTNMWDQFNDTDASNWWGVGDGVLWFNESDAGGTPGYIVTRSKINFTSSDTWTFELRYNFTQIHATYSAWTFLNMGFRTTDVKTYGCGHVYNTYETYCSDPDAADNHNQNNGGTVNLSSAASSSDGFPNIMRLQHLDINNNLVQFSNDGGSTWTSWINITGIAGDVPKKFQFGKGATGTGYGLASTYIYFIDYVKPSTANNMTFSLGAEETAGSDWGSPTFYDNQSSTPANYNPSVYSTENVTWNTSTPYNYSEICLNASGSWYCYETTRVNSNRSTYQHIAPATTFLWYMGANDSNNNWEYTLNYSETIAQNSSMSCYQTYDQSSPLNYGINLAARCSCTQLEGIVGMFRNDTNVTAQNNTGISLSAGSHDYICNVTSSDNYTSESDSDTFNINRINPTWYSIIGGSASNMSSFPTGSNVTINHTIETLTNECEISSCFNTFWLNDTLGDWDPADDPMWNHYAPNNFQYFGWNNSLAVDDWYFMSNNSMTENYSSSFIIYGFTIGGGLTIDVLDELTSGDLTFNLSLSNSTHETVEYNLAIFQPNSTNMIYGNITLIYSATGYPARVSYLTNITNSTNESIVLYLLSSTEGVYVTFFVYSNVYPAGYPDVTVTGSKLIGSNTTIADSRISDDEGKGYLFLYPYSIHSIEAIDPNGVSETMDDYYPSAAFILRLSIDDSVEPPDLSWKFTNISYNLTPTDVYIRNTSTNLTLINFTLLSSDSKLQYYGMNISLANGTVIYSNNTTSTTGGFIAVNFNMTGRDGQVITVLTWFKKDGYDFFTWTRKYIVVKRSSWIPDILEAFVPGGWLGIAEIYSQIIALFVSLSGAAGTKKVFQQSGGSLVFMLILAIFVFAGLFNWLIYLNLALLGLILIAGSKYW